MMIRFRKSEIFLLSLAVLGSSVFAQETRQLKFQGAENLYYTEKANLRIRENHTYQGYLYKEVRAYFNLEGSEPLTAGGTEYEYSGIVYVLEDQKRDNRQAKRIDESYGITLNSTDKGHYTTDSALPYPRTRGFPALAAGALKEGETWREYGTQVIVPREGGRATAIEFFCEFKYAGESTYLERRVDVIRAQYATRYKRNQDPDGDPDLTEASGKHLVTIYIEKNGTGWMFLRDQVDEQYRFTDGSTREIEGFYLTWYEGALAGDRDKDAERLRADLEKAGAEDVTVTATNEGVSLSIQNIHFVADQAVILPDELKRLDAVAETLKSAGKGTIKVVGHTADVGTAESQYVLSVERAQVIIQEMVKRGLPAERFIYEGRGGTEPVASNDTEEGRAANRRVEFIILGD